MTSWILIALVALPLAAAAGSLLHAAAFMLAVAGFTNVAYATRTGEGSAFPGRSFRRHVKLAVPALAVVALDATLVWLATGAPAV